MLTFDDVLLEPGASEVHADPGRHLDPADARDQPEHPAAVPPPMDTVTESRLAHRHGPGGRHGGDPQEPVGDGAGRPGARGVKRYESGHGDQPDHQSIPDTTLGEVREIKARRRVSGFPGGGARDRPAGRHPDQTATCASRATPGARRGELMTADGLITVREGATQAEARTTPAAAQDRAADRGGRRLPRRRPDHPSRTWRSRKPTPRPPRTRRAGFGSARPRAWAIRATSAPWPWWDAGVDAGGDRHPSPRPLDSRRQRGQAYQAREQPACR